MAEIARQYSDDGMRALESCYERETKADLADYEGEPWPELLGSLFQASQSPDAGQREGAFRIFATTPGIIEKQHEDTVQAAFAKGFKDDNVAVCA